jgi:hypothetical protein
MSTSRRKFLMAAPALAVAASVPAFAQVQEKQLVHHVYFWLKNPSSKEDLNKLIEGISTLRPIPTVRQFRLGVPAATTKRDVIDDSYAVSLFTVFDDIKGHDVYQEHPVHLKFIEKYSYLWGKVTVYDSMDI